MRAKSSGFWYSLREDSLEQLRGTSAEAPGPHNSELIPLPFEFVHTAVNAPVTRFTDHYVIDFELYYRTVLHPELTTGDST